MTEKKGQSLCDPEVVPKPNWRKCASQSTTDKRSNCAAKSVVKCGRPFYCLGADCRRAIGSAPTVAITFNPYSFYKESIMFAISIVKEIDLFYIRATRSRSDGITICDGTDIPKVRYRDEYLWWDGFQWLATRQRMGGQLSTI
jgi:hypothetical protein